MGYRKKSWEQLVEEWSNEPVETLEDTEEIVDQMVRMGGGNLIGRPSQYENLDQTTSKN